MCNFFSIISNGKGKPYYFDKDLRQQILDGKMKYTADSHASIAEYFKPETKLTEDQVNKYEYDPFTEKFKVDMINVKEVDGHTDRDQVEAFCRRLDFNKVVPNWGYVTDLMRRLKTYKPFNPIYAETMPPAEKIKGIMAQVGAQVGAQVWDQVRAQVWAQVWDQVWAQVRAQVWDQVGAQVGAQVWAQVRAQVGAQVWAQVRAQVWDQVWAQVRAQVWDQVWDQVGAQVWVIAYYAVKLFVALPYEHPAFDLIRLGIMVVNVAGKYKVFGKMGKFLGEIDK
jgi:hypothetical protein